MAAALCVAMYLLLVAPLTARAENLTFVRSADQQRLAPPPPQAPATPKTHLSLDDDGNVMVRFNRVSFTLIYETGGSSLENRIRQNVPREDVASLGGVSVKFGFSF